MIKCKRKVFGILLALFISFAGACFCIMNQEAGELYATTPPESIYANHRKEETIKLTRPMVYKDFTISLGGGVEIQLSSSINLIIIFSIGEDGDIGEELASFSSVDHIYLQAEQFPSRCIIEYFNATNITFTAQLKVSPIYEYHPEWTDIALNSPTNYINYAIDIKLGIEIQLSDQIQLVRIFDVGLDGGAGEELYVFSNTDLVFLDSKVLPSTCIIQYVNNTTFTSTLFYREANVVYVGYSPFCDYIATETNSQNAINQAILEAPQGFKIVIKEGIYSITDDIVIDRTVYLQGIEESTILRADAYLNFGIIYIKASSTIEYLYIDGNNMYSLDGPDVACIYVEPNAVTSWIGLNSCVNSMYGILCRSNADIYSNKFNNNWIGISADFMDSMTISNNECSNNLESGMVITNCNFVYLNNNICEYNSNYGIYVESVSKRLFLIDNQCNNNYIGINIIGMNGRQVYNWYDATLQITRNMCSNNYTGIIMSGANGFITQNTIFNNVEGLHFIGMYGSYVEANAFYNNTMGFMVTGDNNFLLGNIFEGSRQVGMLVSGAFNTIRESMFNNNGTAIYMQDSSNSVILQNNFHQNKQGIHLDVSFNNEIGNNYIYGNEGAIKIDRRSSDNAVVNNYIAGCIMGIEITFFSCYNYISDNTCIGISGIVIDQSCNNYILNNTFSNSHNGAILIDNFSCDNIISGNTLYDNGYGIMICNSSFRNIITWNTISDSRNAGILDFYDSESLIENNILFNNLIDYEVYY